MILFILFGQRKEDYPEQYAPEALEIMDEYAFSENGQWLQDKLEEYEKSNAFDAVKILRIDLRGADIRELLIGTPVLKGTVDELL